MLHVKQPRTSSTHPPSIQLHFLTSSSPQSAEESPLLSGPLKYAELVQLHVVLPELGLSMTGEPGVCAVCAHATVLNLADTLLSSVDSVNSCSPQCSVLGAVPALHYNLTSACIVELECFALLASPRSPFPCCAASCKQPRRQLPVAQCHHGLNARVPGGGGAHHCRSVRAEAKQGTCGRMTLDLFVTLLHAKKGEKKER